MATADGTGKIYISAVEWTEIMLEMAPFLKHTQFSLGPITSNEGGFEVEYAFGDEVHPKDWSTPPWWMARKAAK